MVVLAHPLNIESNVFNGEGRAMNLKNQRLFGVVGISILAVSAVLLTYGILAHDVRAGIAFFAGIGLVVACAAAIRIAEFKRRRK